MIKNERKMWMKKGEREKGGKESYEGRIILE